MNVYKYVCKFNVVRKQRVFMISFGTLFGQLFTLSLPFCLAVSSTLATKCRQQNKKGGMPKSASKLITTIQICMIVMLILLTYIMWV